MSSLLKSWVERFVEDELQRGCSAALTLFWSLFTEGNKILLQNGPTVISIASHWASASDSLVKRLKLSPTDLPTPAKVPVPSVEFPPKSFKLTVSSKQRAGFRCV
jgi:hypothetical protein